MKIQALRFRRVKEYVNGYGNDPVEMIKAELEVEGQEKQTLKVDLTDEESFAILKVALPTLQRCVDKNFASLKEDLKALEPIKKEKENV